MEKIPLPCREIYKNYINCIGKKEKSSLQQTQRYGCNSSPNNNYCLTQQFKNLCVLNYICHVKIVKCVVCGSEGNMCLFVPHFIDPRTGKQDRFP